MKTNKWGSQTGFKKALLPFTISSLLLGAPALMAAEEDAAAEQVERIAITGSRIKRVDMEGASPVISITAADMELSGFSTVSDVLRNSTLNSFGSFGGASNNGWSSQAQVALRGADPRQTLVLIDGVRLTKSPVTGGSANLNMIPTAAIQRIDILTDGASAVYGSDAVAGVINVILKRDYEGAEFSAKLETPDTIDSGDSQRYTFTAGGSSDKTSFVFAWEHYKEEQVLYADLPYAKAQLKEEGLDPRYLDNWHGISPTGRALEQWSNGWVTQSLNQENNCDVYNGQGSGTFIGPLTRLSDESYSICGYDWTQAAQVLPETRRDSVMANFTYSLTEDTSMFVRGMWMNQNTVDVSAGDPAWFPVDDALPARTITTSDGTTLNLTPVEAGGWFGYRMNSAGDRTADHNDNSLDLAVGFDGNFGDVYWDLSANYARYDAFTWGTNYTSTPQLSGSVGGFDDDGVWQGWDPRDPESRPPASVSANFDKFRRATQTAVRGGLQFDIVELPAGALSTYVGASHTRETYYSKIDGQAEAGNVSGGNGGSGGVGSRTVSAAFTEVAIPVIEGMEVKLAARYDDYSDFGGTFNPQANISYRPIDSLLLRASIGSGFQAPLLTDLYSDVVRGYAENEVDFIGCYQDGISIGDCEYRTSYWASSGGNPDLEPKESDNTNLGVVWQFSDGWSLSADYWTLDVEGRVDTIDHELLQIMQIQIWETEGQNVPISARLPGVDILYRGDNVSEIISPLANAGLRESAGLDMTLTGKFDFEAAGELDFDLNWSHMVAYKTSFINEEGGVELGEDELGDVYRPQDRINANITWSLGDHAVNLYSYYISAQENAYVDDNGEKQVTNELDSFTGHNLTYTYNAPWDATVSIAALNVLDEDTPRETSSPREPVLSLYDVRGRVFTLNYTQRF